MDFKAFLTEMPITTFQKLGKWGEKNRPYGYKKDDIGILTSEKGVEKIKRHWFNTTQNFDFYFLRSPEGNRVVEVGEVSPEYLQNTLKINLIPNPNNITVIFTNNKGTERIPMTAWAIAHRFSHAIRRTIEWGHFNDEFLLFMRNTIKNVYNYEAKLERLNFGKDQRLYPSRDKINNKSTERAFFLLAKSLGTMKSTREGKLLNVAEFQHELLAQFLITGKIKFNPLPKQLINRYAWGNPVDALYARKSQEEMEEFNEYLQTVAETLEYYINETVNSMEGRIFVM